MGPAPGASIGAVPDGAMAHRPGIAEVRPDSSHFAGQAAPPPADRQRGLGFDPCAIQRRARDWHARRVEHAF